MPELVGRSLGRYRIVELLGSGGMGEVYRARDSTLSRDVAIKVLSDAITQNPRHLERFQREARSLAQLSHPNILAIHDFRTDEGVTYAVEELLEGRDLGRIVESGGCSLQEAIDIVCAVAEGLGAAHRKGILHRDIKPENIFSTRNGGVKILDFGLARTFDRVDPNASTRSERSELTSPGAVVGTTSYMSPEQARGEELGPPSDVFSLGVVFYELLTGVHPFRKKSAAETTASILHEDPLAPSVTEPKISPAIDALVGRCLNKRSEERFESARDIAFALKVISGQVSAVSASDVRAADEPSRLGRTWLAVAGIVAILLVGAAAVYSFLIPPPLPDIKQITVTRFEADGDDPELAYIAAGLSEVVAAGLEIVAESSPEIEWVEAWRLQKRRSAEELGDAYRDFNIPVGVTGRVERSGDELAIGLEVVDASGGETLRSFEITDSILNPYGIQVTPAVRIAEALDVAIDEDMIERIRAPATDVPPSLEPYLEGLGRLSLAETDEDVDGARRMLQTAAERDGRFARARIAVAQACLITNQQTGDESWLAEGIGQLSPIVDSDDPPVGALLVLARLQRALGDADAELRALSRAVEMYGEHGEARRAYAGALRRAGVSDEAELQYQKAIYLQPTYWPNYHWLATIFAASGRDESAATQYRRVVELAPRYLHGYTNLGSTYLDLGRLELAEETFKQSLRVDGVDNYAAFTNLGALYESQRRFGDAEEMYLKALEVNDADYRVWGNLGWVRTIGRGLEEGLNAFRRAIEMAEAHLELDPSDDWALCDLAGYRSAVGDRDGGLQALERVADQNPTDPEIVAKIAETFEDLEDRDRALEWVARAFNVGVPPSTFDENPTLRDLVSDERYQQHAVAPDR